MYYNYDTLKVINILLFIIQSLGGRAEIVKLFKLVFLADVCHLGKYGSLITGDTYIILYNRPTALHVYLLYQKLLTNNPRIIFENHVYEYFSLEDDTIRNLQKYDSTYISNAEVECIFEVIRSHKESPEEELVQKALVDYSTSMQVSVLSEVPINELAKTGSDTMIRYIIWSNRVREINMINQIFQSNNNGKSAVLRIGSILRLDTGEMETRTYIAIGVSMGQCAFVEIIDRRMFPIEQMSNNLHAYFIGLSNRYEEISETAYIDCSKIYIVNYNNITKNLKINHCIQIDEIKPDDFIRIKDTITSSHTISTRLKEEFFLQ